MASSLLVFAILLLVTSKLSNAALRTYNFTLHGGTKAPGKHALCCVFQHPIQHQYHGRWDRTIANNL